MRRFASEPTETRNMAAPSKAQLLNEVHTLLKKRYKLDVHDERPSVFEAVVYGIVHEGSTREQANQVISRFKDDFFDWNEVRVSSIEEIQGILSGLPDPEVRAQKLRRFLRQLFERAIAIPGLKGYEFALDNLTKKPLKESVKALQEFEALGSEYVLATVIQQALSGHAMPVDRPLRRGLLRLEVIDESTDDAGVRALLERAVPKNRGVEFLELMEELTHDTCVEGPPDCPRCELRKICPTGLARIVAEKAAAKAAPKGKPLPPPPLPPPPPPVSSKPASKAKPAPVPAQPAAPAAKTPNSKAPKGRAPRSK